jgi:hypothetical protein
VMAAVGFPCCGKCVENRGDLFVTVAGCEVVDLIEGVCDVYNQCSRRG